MFFEKNCGKCLFNRALFCVQGQSGLEIKNRNHSWTHFDATNPMTVSYLANKLLLKITFFEVSSTSRFAWIFNNLISRALFWKPSMPLDLCWWLGFNFELKSLFWLTGKNLKIWTILPLGSEIWNWSLEAAVNTQRALLDSYKR